jgi:hypothetical protein
MTERNLLSYCNSNDILFYGSKKDKSNYFVELTSDLNFFVFNLEP